MSEADPRALGDFTVCAEAADVEAFRAATGLPPGGDTLPLTFPMRWLAIPAARAALTALAPEVDLVPIHEAQSFDYRTPLRVGESYRLSLTARRETSPDRLVVVGTIAAADGTARAESETILRLFSTDGVAP